MSHIFTDRLLIMACPLDMAKSIILNRRDMVKRSPISIPVDWPSVQLKSILPYYIEMLENNPNEKRLQIWLIIDAYQRKVIGSLRINTSAEEAYCVDLGYEIIFPYRKQGYGYEAVQTLVEWLFQNQKVKKITAECDLNNTASIRVLEKIGMKCIEKEAPFLKWELKRGVI